MESRQIDVGVAIALRTAARRALVGWGRVEQDTGATTIQYRQYEDSINNSMIV